MSFDAIIVGSGATGSWAAKILTASGLSVLLLEAGPAGADEADIQGWAPDTRQPIQSRCYAFNGQTRHLFVDDVDNPYETHPDTPFLWFRTRQLGGRTVLWHRVTLRMSDRQFKAASTDGFGTDWPITYSQLQPHYDAVEQFLGVTGIAANLEEIPDGHFLPVRLSQAARDFKQAMETEWPERHVTALRRAAELSHGTCCAGLALAVAEATGRLEVRTRAVVSRVITDRGGGRASGVEYVDCRSGHACEARGKVVLLCASAIETTRILLNSTAAAHPDGLGNSNGLLGRYLTEHISGAGAIGLRDGECVDSSEFYIPNFSNRGGRKARFLRGYGIQGYIRPGPGRTVECTLVCFGEMLPRQTNSVSLGRGKDRWGIPVASLQCRLSDNELEMARDQAEQCARILRCVGFEVTSPTGLNPTGCSIHELGTARMGADPATSILNPYNQCWRVPNLFVTDGAAFPSAGFQNPTLTMMAITGRACTHLLREFKAGSW